MHPPSHNLAQRQVEIICRSSVVSWSIYTPGGCRISQRKSIFPTAERRGWFHIPFTCLSNKLQQNHRSIDSTALPIQAMLDVFLIAQENTENTLEVPQCFNKNTQVLLICSNDRIASNISHSGHSECFQRLKQNHTCDPFCTPVLASSYPSKIHMINELTNLKFTGLLFVSNRSQKPNSIPIEKSSHLTIWDLQP